MREGSGGKFDVHCFLFTDMLLVCKSLSRKGERVKVSMIMVSMIIMIMIIMITIVMIKSHNHYHELQKSSLASTLLNASVESHYLFKSILLLNNFVKKEIQTRPLFYSWIPR